MSRASHRNCGFTLIETLIVITILAIIAALLFPVFHHAKESGRQTVCRAHLKQLVQALMTYTHDYDGFTPGGAYAQFALPGGSTIDGNNYTVFFVLSPYVKSEQLFVCPTRTGWKVPRFRPWRGSYAANYQLMGTHESLISEPALLIAFCDSYLPWQDCVANCTNCAGGCSSFIYDRIGRGCFQGDCTKRTDWHNGGINLAFADGHVKWKALSHIFYRNWVRNLSPSDPHYDRPITQDW